ncbi:hypothetical protein F7725_000147 [Dissostichus mawsoni]|uniref:Integrase core domain-containing protein n=1 Tax=Dissostichus mawsoni TaxID=36200 RepID=A0A7J5ZDH8_DISMA|nr:hypothetical protein F7725_000147 [Dissostichus mawsoni]
MDTIIEDYFRRGFTNKDILVVLEESHNIKLSLRTLQRKLQKNKLWRRKKTDAAEVASFIEQQLQTAWLQMDAPEMLDSVAAYGFSRKMIWLEAYKTNNDPRIIAGYLIDSVTENNGCTQRVRLDHGTENTHVAQMQKFLHNIEDENGMECVTLGPSTGNQRIERWWGTLRSECAQFWMDHFDQMKADGYFVGSFLDKSLIQFCFQNTIQEELDHIVVVWNDHRINKQQPSGSQWLPLHNVCGSRPIWGSEFLAAS